MQEIFNYKDLKKILELKQHYLVLIYIYSDSIPYSNVESCLNKEHYNNNVTLLKINSNQKNIMDKLDVTTYPIVLLYKNNELADEIYCSYNNIKTMLNNILSY